MNKQCRSCRDDTCSRLKSGPKRVLIHTCYYALNSLLKPPEARLHFYTGDTAETTDPQGFVLLGIHGKNGVRKQALVGGETIAEATVAELR